MDVEYTAVHTLACCTKHEVTIVRVRMKTLILFSLFALAVGQQETNVFPSGNECTLADYVRTSTTCSG